MARRYLGLFVLAIAARLLGFPIAVSIAVLTLGSLTNLLGSRALRRRDLIPGWVYGLDLASCLGVIAALPDVTIPTVMVMIAILALSAATNELRTTLALVVAASAGLALVAVIVDVPDASMTVTALGLTGFLVVVALAPLTRAEDQARERLNSTLNNLDAVLWVSDPCDGRFAFVNERAETMLGWPIDQWQPPEFWNDRVHPDDLAKASVAFESALRLGIDQEVTYRFRTTADRWVHLHDHITVILDDSGQPIALQGMGIDVTERLRIEQRVGRYAEIVERIDLALLVCGLDEDAPGCLRLQAANRSAEALIGRGLTTRIGDPLVEAVPALGATALAEPLGRVLCGDQPLTVEDLEIESLAGSTRLVTLRAFALASDALAVSLQDTTETVAAAEALKHQALFDGLTGLPNRRLLDEELHRAVREAPGTGESVALLVMDLDQFKEVNDALGHQVGDQLLTEIGRRLSERLDGSLVARLGGDEFAVVLVGDIDVDRAVEVGRDIRDALADPFAIEDVWLQTNASIGIAHFPSQAGDVATLVQRADVAMYQAKRAGSGIAVYAPENDRSSVDRLRLIAELPAAIADGQLRLHYQPTVDLRTGRAVRAEALVRWEHPRLGLLAPVHFIDVAEVSGSIGPLTRWVIAEAIAALACWRAAGHQVGVAVNLSVRNLYDPDLFAYLVDQLAAADMDPSELTLELTETELMDDPGLAQEVFGALGELGVSTSVDDFGTGYSSLTYLLELPLQEIKIDRSFVSALQRDSDEFTIVRSLIDLGHNLGLEVVAEGVEGPGDLALLEGLGCDLAQGYHLSRPLPLADLLSWFEASDQR